MTLTNTIQSDPAVLLPRSRRATGVPVLALAVTAILFFVRYGYDYAAGDQDEIIPYLLHHLDPSLFARDWLVQVQDASFSVREAPVLLLQGLAAVFPIWAAVLLVYVVCWTALAIGIYKVAEELLEDRGAAAATLITTLVLTRQWTLGSNDFASGMLTPSEMAWVVAVWGFLFFLRNRLILAGLLLGLATCFQALVGLHLAGVLVLVMVWDLNRIETRRASAAKLLRFGLSYVAAGVPVLGPLLYQQFVTGRAPGADADILYYILAEFRNPHHYLFLSFPPSAHVKFFLLAAAGSASLFGLNRSGRLRHVTLIRRVFVVVAGLLVLAGLFTELWPTLFVAKLQFFKLTVLLKLLFVGGICGFITLVLPPGVHRLFDVLTTNSKSTLALSGCLVGGFVLAGVGSGLVYESIQPLARRTSAIGQIEEWARTQTARDALFAVPPSNATFRSNARRAVVVNFKAFPFEDRQMPVWFDRLIDLAPIPLPERGGNAAIAPLDSAYHAQPAAAWRRLADTYSIDYVLRHGPLPNGTIGMQVVYRAGNWYVYALETRPPIRQDLAHREATPLR